MRRLVLFICLTCWGTTFVLRAASPDYETVSPRSLWEIGVFGGAVRIPHYRGSDQYSVYVLPFPYFLYRGEILRAGREGLEGVFWSTERIESALSFGGSPPPRNDTKARQGMSKLGAVGEVGPGMRVYLTNPREPNLLTMTWALRATASMDTDDYDVAWQGLRGGVSIYYRNRTLLKAAGVVLHLKADLDFADQTYHRYFYGVRSEDAAADRPAYSPSGGYGGCSISVSGSRQFTDDIALGAYYRYDNISGAAYIESPLVRTENNYTIGLAMIWRLYRSEQRERIPRGHRDTGVLTEW